MGRLSDRVIIIKMVRYCVWVDPNIETILGI